MDIEVEGKIGIDVEVEVRELTVVGAKAPTLDEIVLYVNGRCLFHLEQLDVDHWFLGIGDRQEQYVRCNLYTKRGEICGTWEDEGASPSRVRIEGKASQEV